MHQQIKNIYNAAKPDTPIESRVSFHTDEADLYLYETKTSTYNFNFSLNEVSLISMLAGKKVMHFDMQTPFDFFPEESLMLDKNTMVNIDFPEADQASPTRCLALVLSPDEVRNTLLMLNEKVPRLNDKEWALQQSSRKFKNDAMLKNNIEKMILLAGYNSEYRATLSKLAMRELIISLLQSSARDILFKETTALSTNDPLAFVIQYIRNNPDKNFTINEIADKAYMSKSTFHRHFKRETGITPSEFILAEKMKRAKMLLRDSRKSVAEIAYALGFATTSQFIAHFKRFTGITPYKFKMDK